MYYYAEQRQPARISIRQILKMEFFRKPQNATQKRLSATSLCACVCVCLFVWYARFIMPKKKTKKQIYMYIYIYMRVCVCEARRHRQHNFVCVSTAKTSFCPNICSRTNRFLFFLLAPYRLTLVHLAS